MRDKQRGITFIGWLLLLVPLAIVVYAGIRVAPMYLNYMKVARTLDSVSTEFRDGNGANPQTLRVAIQKHFDIEVVESPTIDDIKITRDGRSWLLEAAFDAQTPLFANISLQIAFDKSVRIGSAE
jgi:hypothetical protein